MILLSCDCEIIISVSKDNDPCFSIPFINTSVSFDEKTNDEMRSFLSIVPIIIVLFVQISMFRS